MRLSACLLTAAFLSTGVTAFYPFEFKFDQESAADGESNVDELERRFYPWSLEDGEATASVSTGATLELRRVSGKVGCYCILSERPTCCLTDTTAVPTRQQVQGHHGRYTLDAQ